MFIKWQSWNIQFIVVVYFQLMHLSQCQKKDVCNARETTKFVIYAEKNSTAHWSSTVALKGSDAYGVASSDGFVGPESWKVNIDFRNGGCLKETFSATITVPPTQAGPKYELFEDIGYYKFHTELKTWSEAQKVCEKEGAHLAIINSENESDVLKELLSRHPGIANTDYTDLAAIGFHDRYNEGDYLTVFDKPLATTGFTRWSRDNDRIQPDNRKASEAHPGEDCGGVSTDGGLNDIFCDSPVPFICEQDF